MSGDLLLLWSLDETAKTVLLQWKGKHNYPSKDLNSEGQWGQERIQHCCPLWNYWKQGRRKGEKEESNFIFPLLKPLSLQGKQRIEWVPERCFLLLWHFKTTLNLQQWVLGGAKVAVWLRKWGIVKGKGDLWLPPAPSYQLKATQRERERDLSKAGTQIHNNTPKFISVKQPHYFAHEYAMWTGLSREPCSFLIHLASAGAAQRLGAGIIWRLVHLACLAINTDWWLGP